jgi:carbamate kinase
MRRPPANPERRRMVIALGGNAIMRRGEDGTLQQQFEHANACMQYISQIIQEGHQIVLTHGNGPIVGNIVIRYEALRYRIPPMPLYIADADSEGGIGFLLQMSLYNQLRKHGVTRPIVTVITQVVVDPGDPALQNPTKPIGPYYNAQEASRLAKEEGWSLAEEAGRGYRRVVPSPRPQKIIEAPVILSLMEQGDVVIAAGGGGIPVEERTDGTLKGVDAVIDKDWASGLLACQVGADFLVILMEEDRVYLNYGRPEQRGLRRVKASEMERYLREGHFPPGSMGPKVAASVHFLRTCGQEAIICRAESIMEAMAGSSGTRIARDDSS